MTNNENEITLIINCQGEDAKGPPEVECDQFKITEADKWIRSKTEEELEAMSVSETEEYYKKYLKLCTDEDEDDSDSDEEEDWNEMIATIQAIRNNPLLHD